MTVKELEYKLKQIMTPPTNLAETLGIESNCRVIIEEFSRLIRRIAKLRKEKAEIIKNAQNCDKYHTDKEDHLYDRIVELEAKNEQLEKDKAKLQKRVEKFVRDREVPSDYKKLFKQLDQESHP